MDRADPFGEKMLGSRNRDTKMCGVIGLIEAGSNRISGRAELVDSVLLGCGMAVGESNPSSKALPIPSPTLSPKRYQEDWLQYATRLDFSRKQRRMHTHVSKAKARLRHVDKAGSKMQGFLV